MADMAANNIVAVYLWWVGCAVVTMHMLRMSWKLAIILYTFRPLRRHFDWLSCGTWAVVTGCTDGIGLEYAEQLAARGLNVVLVSRSPTKLADTALNIRTRHGVQTKVIVADFTDGVRLYASVEQQLSGLDVAVLVNNVGISGPMGRFLQIPNREAMHPAILNCNCLSTVAMTSIVLPHMLAKRRGVVISMSSMVGEGQYLMPFSVYPATKSFVSTLGRSLCAELRGQGIVVQNLTTGIVMTKPLMELKQLSRMVTSMGPSPRTYVRSALATVGLTSDTCGYLPHQLSKEFVAGMPSWLWRRVTDWLGMTGGTSSQ